MFRNESGVAFIDEWEDSGIDPGGDRHGAAWGDFDNDGRRDLYVAIGAHMGQGIGYNQLYHNLDGAHFESIGLSSGISDPFGRSRFCYWIDADNDGWLDVFVCNMGTPNQLFINQGDGHFLPADDAGGLGADDLWYADWTQFTNDRDIDVILSAAGTGRLVLFENSGSGTFQDITATSELPQTLWGVRGLCWFDYDNDGNQDLYVSRGGFSCAGDALWRDSTEVRFLMVLPSDPDDEDGLDGIDIAADAAGLRFTIHINWDREPFDQIFLGASSQHPTSNPFTMEDGEHLGEPEFTPGVDCGCYIWQDNSGESWRIRCSTDFARKYKFGGQVFPVSGSITSVTSTGIEIPVCTVDVSDKLYRNRGDGTFEDVTDAAIIPDARDGRTCIAADFNNDGWQDIYVVSARNLSGYVAHNESNLLHMNNGDGTFTECAIPAGADCQVAGTGSGTGWADYNDDGFPDLFVTNGWECFPFNLGPHVVYRNDGNENHWLKVRLVGVTCNRDAIGSMVWIVADGIEQYRVQNGAVSDMSQSSMDLHFGLGKSTVVDTLIVRWPSGPPERFTDLTADATHILEQGSGTAVPDELPRPKRALLWPARPNPACTSVALTYQLPALAEARLRIYDAEGRWVQTLLAGSHPAGRHTSVWDGCDSAGRRAGAGIYYARLMIGNATQCRRITLLD